MKHVLLNPLKPYTYCSLQINIAVVFPSQDQDFCLLHPQDPLFQTFSGETLRYKGSEPLYPFFINECAYYEKGIALSLARKKRVRIPAIRVQTEEEEKGSEKAFASEEEEWGCPWHETDLNFFIYLFFKKAFIEVTSHVRTHSRTIFVYNGQLFQLTATFTADSQMSYVTVHSHIKVFVLEGWKCEIQSDLSWDYQNAGSASFIDIHGLH